MTKQTTIPSLGPCQVPSIRSGPLMAQDKEPLCLGPQAGSQGIIIGSAELVTAGSSYLRLGSFLSSS